MSRNWQKLNTSNNAAQSTDARLTCAGEDRFNAHRAVPNMIDARRSATVSLMRDTIAPTEYPRSTRYADALAAILPLVGIGPADRIVEHPCGYPLCTHELLLVP